MPSRRIHLLRAVAMAYPFAAWLFACGLIARTFFTGGTPDRSMWLMLLAAPVAIPLLMLYGIGYWVGGYRHENEIPWWCLGLLVAWLVCFAAIRAIAKGVECLSELPASLRH